MTWDDCEAIGFDNGQENANASANMAQARYHGSCLRRHATMIVGLNNGGWYTGSSAETLAQTRSTAAVVEALVPVCIGQSQSDPETIAKLKAFSTIKSSYEQRDFVMKAGWATMPSTEAPNQALASACAEVLAKSTGS